MEPKFGQMHSRWINIRSDWRRSREEGHSVFLTQFLTGHGMFHAYLFRYKRRDSPLRLYCPEETDDANHTFFVCDRWIVAGQVLRAELRDDSSPNNVVTLML